MLKRMMALVLALALSLTLISCAPGTTPDNSKTKTPATGETAGSDNGATADSGDFYVIGCAQPLSGNNALYGEAAVNAATLAVSSINANGGLNGKQVKLISYDDQSSPEEAVKIATKMIDVDHVDAVVESVISSCVLAAGKYLNEAGIPTFGTGLSPTWMAEDWDYVFRACLNTDYVMPNLVEMMQAMDMDSAAIFQSQDDAGKAAGTAFQKACEAAGISITTTESFNEGDTDFSGQVAKIIDSGADTIFLAVTGATMPLIAKQLRQFGFEGIVLNKESFPLDAITIAADAASFVAFANPYVDYADVESCDVPAIKAFLTEYEAAFEKLPMTDCAYRTYDSIMIIAEAATIAGSNDATAVKDAIKTISGYEGLGGTFDFTAGDREGLHTVNKFVVIDGAYTSFENWLADGGYDALLAEIG